MELNYSHISRCGHGTHFFLLNFSSNIGVYELHFTVMLHEFGDLVSSTALRIKWE